MSFYTRFFFKCVECDFMISLLGQASRQSEIESCPCCHNDLDYAPPKRRKDYIKALKEELSDMEDEKDE
jgi:hypothetical protein